MKIQNENKKQVQREADWEQQEDVHFCVFKAQLMRFMRATYSVFIFFLSVIQMDLY